MDEVERLIEQATHKRSVGCTAMNSQVRRNTETHSCTRVIVIGEARGRLMFPSELLSG